MYLEFEQLEEDNRQQAQLIVELQCRLTDQQRSNSIVMEQNSQLKRSVVLT